MKKPRKPSVVLKPEKTIRVLNVIDTMSSILDDGMTIHGYTPVTPIDLLIEKLRSIRDDNKDVELVVREMDYGEYEDSFVAVEICRVNEIDNIHYDRHLTAYNKYLEKMTLYETQIEEYNSRLRHD